MSRPRAANAGRRPVIALILKSNDPVVARKAKPYAEWIARGGGEVRVVTPASRHPLTGADGVVLVGGEDVAPERYGETNRACETINTARDAFEWRVLPSALRRDMPVLAVCRGIQVLAAALGGTLYQDLSTERDRPRSRVVHRGPRQTDTRHRIALAPATRLGRLIKRPAILVNSHHHQAIHRLPPETVVAARSFDGVIEAIEHRRHRFVLGVQWHPERWFHPSSEAIMRGFLDACRGE